MRELQLKSQPFLTYGKDDVEIDCEAIQFTKDLPNSLKEMDRERLKRIYVYEDQIYGCQAQIKELCDMYDPKSIARKKKLKLTIEEAKKNRG